MQLVQAVISRRLPKSQRGLRNPFYQSPNKIGASKATGWGQAGQWSRWNGRLEENNPFCKTGTIQRMKYWNNR